MKRIINPYLPLYEYVPDCEPHVFGDRVYIYGSHDSRSDAYGYCGKDHVTWSAPLDDLTDWRFENTLIDTSALVGVTYTDAEGNAQSLKADTVFYAVGMAPNRQLYFDIADKAPFVDLIGDAKQVARIGEATSSGYFAGLDIGTF